MVIPVIILVLNNIATVKNNKVKLKKNIVYKGWGVLY
jgi:hypothetical protein